MRTKFCTNIEQSEGMRSITVFAVASTPGYRNHRIGTVLMRHGKDNPTESAKADPPPLTQGRQRTPLAPLRKGSCRRSRLRGRFFKGAFKVVPIHLLREPGDEGAGKTGFAPHYGIASLAFPLRGRCRACATDEV